MRRIGSVALLVLAGALLLVGVLAGWARNTVYDSNTFSSRSTAILDSPAVRQELATALTVQLAHSGNQQAINFRPALQLAIEAAVDTDTFRSIFRAAVRPDPRGGAGGPEWRIWSRSAGFRDRAYQHSAAGWAGYV